MLVIHLAPNSFTLVNVPAARLLQARKAPIARNLSRQRYLYVKVLGVSNLSVLDK